MDYVANIIITVKCKFFLSLLLFRRKMFTTENIFRGNIVQSHKSNSMNTKSTIPKSNLTNFSDKNYYTTKKLDLELLAVLADNWRKIIDLIEGLSNWAVEPVSDISISTNSLTDANHI